MHRARSTKQCWQSPLFRTYLLHNVYPRLIPSSECSLGEYLLFSSVVFLHVILFLFVDRGILERHFPTTRREQSIKRVLLGAYEYTPGVIMLSPI